MDQLHGYPLWAGLHGRQRRQRQQQQQQQQRRSRTSGVTVVPYYKRAAFRHASVQRVLDLWLGNADDGGATAADDSDESTSASYVNLDRAQTR
jgi:hypothetical protein